VHVPASIVFIRASTFFFSVGIFWCGANSTTAAVTFPAGRSAYRG
jgi:hypothetical protein